MPFQILAKTITTFAKKYFFYFFLQKDFSFPFVLISCKVTRLGSTIFIISNAILKLVNFKEVSVSKVSDKKSRPFYDNNIPHVP